MKKLNITFGRRSAILSSVIAFLAVCEPQCVSIMAQTHKSSISSVSDLYAKAKGEVITKDNYAKYVTTGNPGNISTDMTDDEANKIFVLYNKGTGKFLSYGGYWGVAARLSSVPCPFWLQLRSDDDKVNLQYTDNYVRYPEKEGETVSSTNEPINQTYNFPTGYDYSVIQSGLYFGSQEGKNRSHANYKSIQIVKSDGTTKDVNIYASDASNHITGDAFTVSSANPYSPQGNKFKSEELSSLKLADGDKFVVKLDLSTCIEGNEVYEDIFSLGDAIQVWDKSKNNIHLYFDKKQRLLSIQIFSGKKNEFKEQKYTIDVLNDVTITVDKTSCTVTSQNFHYSIPYNKDKAGRIAKFKYENGNYVIDNDGNMQLVDDGTGKEYNDKNITQNYFFSEQLNDTNPVLFISRRIIQGNTANLAEDKYLAYVLKSTSSVTVIAAEKSAGVYTDRSIQTNSKFSPEFARWEIIPTSVEGEYRLALNMKVNLSTGTNSNQDNPKQATYYLTVSENYISGATKYKDTTEENNKKYFYYSTVDSEGKRKYIDHFTEGLLNVQMTETMPSDDNGIWKFISAKDYIDMLKQQTSALKESVDFSFILSDPDFARNNAGLSGWKVDDTMVSPKITNYSETLLRIGYDGYYKNSVNTNDYLTYGNSNYNFDDSENRGAEDYCANHSRYMCASVHHGGYGRMYQSVKVTRPGWYVIRCQGLSTVDAKLYSVITEGGATESKTLETPFLKITDQWLRDSLHILKQENAYWPYDRAVPMYNAAVYMNDEHAYPNGVEKTTAQLLYYIHSASKESPANIEFGVQIPKTEWKALYNTENGKNRYYTSDFTAFDNFRLLFGGEETHEPYLVLDENDETLNHLDGSIHKYKSTDTVNKHLLLHRTFTYNQWNTIILPVGLTKSQFEGAFGTNARLAELSSIDLRRIYFKTINKAEKYTKSDGSTADFTDDTEYWLKPMTPYLIKIKDADKIKGSKTEKYTAYLFRWADNGKTYEEKSVGGSADCPYYDIEHINMVEGIAHTKTDGNFDHWDFLGMKGDGKYSYVIKGQITNPDSQQGTVTAYGMLTRNYTVGTDGKNALLDTHSPMEDAYILTSTQDGTNVLKYKSKGAASKAFRCWFQYLTPKPIAAKAQFAVSIDDIEEPLSIDDINDNDFGTTTVARYSDGIYTLEGRKVGDASMPLNALPKGFYIVNGKKTHN